MVFAGNPPSLYSSYTPMYTTSALRNFMPDRRARLYRPPLRVSPIRVIPASKAKRERQRNGKFWTRALDWLGTRPATGKRQYGLAAESVTILFGRISMQIHLPYNPSA